jgi:type II secretory pathway pseudopilin PulG
MTMENEQSHIATRSPLDRGFTLFEILVVVGLILFLSRLTFFHFTGGPQAHQLEAAIKNVGSYFNSASQTASSSRQWVIVVVNVDSDTEGYLRQLGTYKWFHGPEPFDDENGDGLHGNSEDFLDINGNESHDNHVVGWVAEDVKGNWLPEKIYFDLSRSGAAAYAGNGFIPEKDYPSTGKFMDFSMEHENNVGPDLNEALEAGRIPFFLDRSGYRQGASQSGPNKILQSGGNGSANDKDESPLHYELDFSQSANKWLFFAFDEHGNYINIGNPKVTGGSINKDAQRDFIVLSQGVINYQSPPDQLHEIQPTRGRDVPGVAAFLMHQSGNYTIIEDETQIPK